MSSVCTENMFTIFIQLGYYFMGCTAPNGLSGDPSLVINVATFCFILANYHPDDIFQTLYSITSIPQIHDVKILQHGDYKLQHELQQTSDNVFNAVGGCKINELAEAAVHPFLRNDALNTFSG